MRVAERDKLSEVIGKYGQERRNLIPLLQEIQAELGYLPQEAMQEVASFLGIPKIEVYGVATFYNQFRFTPLGKHHVRVCMGTACHLRGGKLILEALERELNLKVGQTAPDRSFSLERVACVGCCMLAPVVLIGEEIHPRMTPFKMEEDLVPYRQEIDELPGNSN
jgi:NADH-quinone oxidoreductase subunit E